MHISFDTDDITMEGVFGLFLGIILFFIIDTSLSDSSLSYSFFLIVPHPPVKNKHGRIASFPSVLW